MAGPAPNQAAVDAVFERLNNISTSIRGSRERVQQFEEFRGQLQRRLGSMLAQLQAIRNAVGLLSTARAELQALRQRLVSENIPSAEDVTSLNAIIEQIDPNALTADLDRLRDEVVALERAVGIEPNRVDMPPQGGGYMSSARARTARAKRLTTRKRKHSRQATRKHRRRKRRLKGRRHHKKRTRH